MSRPCFNFSTLNSRVILALHQFSFRSAGLKLNQKETVVVKNRFMSQRARKKFYKDVSVVSAGKQSFEITLDSKKLKTPGKAVFAVGNEALALAVAHEWESQKDLVLFSQMHLTGLCNTSIDNPTGAKKYDLVDKILNILETDTILFFSDNQENLRKRQMQEWKPIIDWFSEKYQISITPSTSLPIFPKISFGAKDILRRHLLCYNFEAVHGFSFGTDAIKSIILMFAIVEKKLTVEQAVNLSGLETDFQIQHWGNVEWAHKLEFHDTMSRVAAAELFIQCNSNEYCRKSKKSLIPNT